MRKLSFLLFVLLAAQSYGVYGAWQARRVVYTCTFEVGPLCYAWEQSAIGKALGAGPSKDVEEALQKSREAWDDQVAKRIKKIDRKDVKKVVDDAVDRIGDAFDKLGDSAHEVIEKAKE